MIGSNERSLELGEKPNWLAAIPFMIVNLLGIYGLRYVFTSWSVAVVMISLYFVRMFFITGFQHRYFSHRSFVITPRWGEKFVRGVQFLMALLVTSSAQKGVLWWASHHRHHHKHSDTEEDVHSRFLRGFYWSHLGWILCRRFDKTDSRLIPDLVRFPELVFLDRRLGYLIMPVVLSLVCLWFGGWPMLCGGFFTSTFFLYHGTFSINSLAHMWGTQRYQTGDQSRNSLLLAIITMGEGWHNNHHFSPGYEPQALTRFEKCFDWTHQILYLISLTGLISLRTKKA